MSSEREEMALLAVLTTQLLDQVGKHYEEQLASNQRKLQVQPYLVRIDSNGSDKPIQEKQQAC